MRTQELLAVIAALALAPVGCEQSEPPSPGGDVSRRPEPSEPGAPQAPRGPESQAEAAKPEEAAPKPGPEGFPSEPGTAKAPEPGAAGAEAPAEPAAKAEGSYPEAVAFCATIARRTCETLEFTISGQDALDTWAQIDAQTKDAVPVRFRMEKVTDHETRVTFSAGASAAPEHEALVAKIKTEYERILALPKAPAEEPIGPAASP